MGRLITSSKYRNIAENGAGQADDSQGSTSNPGQLVVSIEIFICCYVDFATKNILFEARVDSQSGMRREFILRKTASAIQGERRLLNNQS